MSKVTYIISKESCERAPLTISRSILQGSCSWDGKRSSLICSSSLSALLCCRACSRESSVLLCQKIPTLCQQHHQKGAFCIPELKGGYKIAVPEKVYDSLHFSDVMILCDLLRFLISCVFSPETSQHQWSNFKRHLEYVKRTMWKSPTANQRKMAGARTLRLRRYMTLCNLRIIVFWFSAFWRL
jgi:hypothetical protein